MSAEPGIREVIDSMLSPIVVVGLVAGVAAIALAFTSAGHSKETPRAARPDRRGAAPVLPARVELASPGTHRERTDEPVGHDVDVSAPVRRDDVALPAPGLPLASRGRVIAGLGGDAA